MTLAKGKPTLTTDTNKVAASWGVRQSKERGTQEMDLARAFEIRDQLRDLDARLEVQDRLNGPTTWHDEVRAARQDCAALQSEVEDAIKEMTAA